MSQKTLKAHTSVGKFTRQTGSTYTHVVVWESPRAAEVALRGLARQGVQGRWVKDRGYGVTWHSSERSAQNATRGYKWDLKARLVGVFAVGKG